MQVDEFSGVDIPIDTQENREGRDIQGYLESLNRSPTTEVSSSSDADIPEDRVTKVADPTPHMGPQRKKQPRRQPPTATKAPGSIGRQARQAQTASVDRMHMGGALEALLSVDAQDDFFFFATDLFPEEILHAVPVHKLRRPKSPRSPGRFRPHGGRRLGREGGSASC